MLRNRRSVLPATQSIAEIASSLACFRKLLCPIIVLTGDHYVTTKCLDVGNLRATAHDVYRRKRSERARCRTSWPTLERRGLPTSRPA